MNADKLKACPFCGGEASYGEASYGEDHSANALVHHFVNCVECNASTNVLTLSGATKDDAIAAWNTRTQDGGGEAAFAWIMPTSKPSLAGAVITTIYSSEYYSEPAGVGLIPLYTHPRATDVEDARDAARLDFVEMYALIGTDSVSGLPSGNGQRYVACTRKNIDAAIANSAEGGA